MDKYHSRRIHSALVYLVGCAYHGITPDVAYLKGIQKDQLFKCAVRHNVASLLCSALEGLGLSTPEMQDKKNMAIRKVMLLDAERQAILSELEGRGIIYMPLKGVYMKEYYPAIGMRQMTDNDILFDKAYRADVRDLMTARGYSVRVYGKSNHDVYMKDPVYNYEMHVSLFDGYKHSAAAEYFKGAFDRALPIEGTSYGYRMNLEDFYLYMRAHEYKHFVNSGTGLRSLLDVYVFWHANEGAVDSELINKVSEKIGMGEYERRTRALADRLFSPESIKKILEDPNALTESEWSFFDEFCLHGTYGTLANSINRGIVEAGEGRVTAKSKLKYVWKKLFPPMEWYKIYHPTVYKYKILMPPFLLFRFFRIIFSHPKRLFIYIKNIIKAKGKDANDGTR